MNKNNFPKGGAITCIIGYALAFVPYVILIILMFTNNLITFFVMLWLVVGSLPILIFNIVGLIISCLALKNPKIRISLWILAIFSLNIISLIGGIINHVSRPSSINVVINQNFQQ